MSTQLLILLASVLEVLLLGCLVWFFLRLKRSEELITRLQSKQSEFLEKIDVSARLEQELMTSFEERQQELVALAEDLEARETQLRNLLKQANELSRSPQFLRHLVLSGHRQGRSVQALSRATGLSPDEVELIIQKERSS